MGYKKYKPLNSRKIPSKKVCRYCNQIYYKPISYNNSQWMDKIYCSKQCSGAASRKYDDKNARGEAWRRRQGILVKGSLESNKKISELTKLAMSRPDVQKKIRMKKKPLTMEHKLKLSEVHKGKLPKNLMYHTNSYPNVKRGYYDINGTTIFFRSMWEANYALYLDFLIEKGKIIKWEFEPDTFIFEKIKLGTRSYTPDFKIYGLDGSIEYHEVKGYMDSKSKTKLKRMDKYYPDIKLHLVSKDEYCILKKQVGKLCNFY